MRAPPRRMTAMGAPGAHYILDDDARARPVSRGLPELTAIRLDTRADGGPVDALVLPSDASHRDHAAGRARTCASAPAAAGAARPPSDTGRPPTAPAPARTNLARSTRAPRSSPDPTGNERTNTVRVIGRVARRTAAAPAARSPRTNDAASRDIVFPDLPPRDTARVVPPPRFAAPENLSEAADPAGGRSPSTSPALATWSPRPRFPVGTVASASHPRTRGAKRPGTGTGTGTPRRRRHARDDPGERTWGPTGTRVAARKTARGGKTPAIRGVARVPDGGAHA